jgi:hypothetical protein
MAYKINYPYYGITYDGIYFVIIQPKYMVAIEHQGTHGFGFAAYISRPKIIKFFRYSKEITQLQFQDVIKNKAGNFFNNIPKSEIVLSPVQNVKLLTHK